MNKRVLVTGGNGGIAVAIKEELQSHGFHVYAPGRLELDVTDIKSIEQVVSEFVPDILKNFNDSVRSLFSSGITTGGIVAILANLIIRSDKN